jgi:hypothetical protein
MCHDKHHILYIAMDETTKSILHMTRDSWPMAFWVNPQKLIFNIVETWAKRKPLHTPIWGGGGRGVQNAYF